LASDVRPDTARAEALMQIAAMCGRFTQHLSWADIRRLADLVGAPRNLPPRYNIAPTTRIEAIRIGEGGAELVSMRWGLVPSWWKKPLSELPATFNARAETLTERPMFRNAYKSRRCIVPASGFYEWVRHEVVSVIVRQRHLAGPAVPSAVPYEVERLGDEPFKSPRTKYPAVSRRMSKP
jgi:putative SOS response-associated peptidase YedK